MNRVQGRKINGIFILKNEYKVSQISLRLQALKSLKSSLSIKKYAPSCLLAGCTSVSSNLSNLQYMVGQLTVGYLCWTT